MAPVYRDHHAALRHRLAEARRRVAELEEGVTPAFWRVLPADVSGELTRLRDAASRAPDPAASIDALAGYAERLGATMREASAQCDAWNPVPDDCPRPTSEEPGFPWGSLAAARPALPTEVLDALRARVASITARLDPWRTLEDFGRHGVLATLRVGGAPLVLTAVPHAPRGWSARGLTEVAMRVRTSVRRGAGRVRLHPVADSFHVLTFFPRRAPMSLGDPEFDGWFSLDAEPGAGPAALSGPVRASLCAVARDDPPTLEVDGGVAELRWRFEPSHATVRAAVEALVGIRAAPPMPLLRESSQRRRER